jgi:hypothetical protein
LIAIKTSYDTLLTAHRHHVIHKGVITAIPARTYSGRKIFSKPVDLVHPLMQDRHNADGAIGQRK